MRGKRDSDKEELRKRLERSRSTGEFDFDLDEVTDVIDLVTEDTRRRGEKCIEETEKQVKRIGTWEAWPPPPVEAT